jgi:hypothetical protein
MRARASGVSNAAPIERASSASCSANERLRCERISRLASPYARCAPVSHDRATSSARSPTASGAVISATRPHSSASVADSIRSCSTSCSARRSPTARASCAVTDRSGVSPMFAYRLPICESVAMTA